MKEIILALSTHWDREWWLGQQAFRYRLVETLDAALDLLEKNPAISVFHLDGQTMALEDYLEARPQNEPRLRALAAQGRLQLGPWYTMSDVFLVSGESLLRNFSRGMNIARSFGCDYRQGYMCDLFGFNSQMPQILQFMGIESAFLFRGLGQHIPTDFTWASPNGSRVFCHRFSQDSGYCEFYAWVRCPDRDRGLPLDVAAAAERAEKFLAARCGESESELCLVMDGSDHADLEPRILDLVDAINARLKGTKLRIGSLMEFVQRRPTLPPPLPVIEGELRDPAAAGTANWLIQNTLSSYAPLKLWNRRVEGLLTRWTEPFDFLARVGTPELTPATQFLEIAWKWLLQNHAHDSICGSCVDLVHVDMNYRFRQAEEIGTLSLQRSFAALAAKKLPNADSVEKEIVLFNPHLQSVDDVIELDIALPSRASGKFPHDAGGFNVQPVPLLRINDAAGKELPFQLIGIEPDALHGEEVLGAFPNARNIQRVRVVTRAAIPAMGMTVLKIGPHKGLMRPQGTLFKAPATLENEFLRASLDADGSITLLDKKSGRTYSGLFVFEDGGDLGDGWNCEPPRSDEIVFSQQPAQVALLEDGPLRARLRVRHLLRVPRRQDRAAGRRSTEMADLPIDLILTLKAGARLLESEIVVTNNIEDHRLRLLLRTSLKVSTSITSSAFDLVERPLAIPRKDSDRELITTLPTSGVVMLRQDDGCGLAALCPGIYESWVPNDGSGTMILTLLRSFRRTYLTAGESLCQIQGEHRFRVALKPLDAATTAAEVIQALDGFELGIRSFQKDAANGPTPQERSFAELLAGEFCLTALQGQANGAFILRGYNPSKTATEVALRVDLPFVRVEATDGCGRSRGKVTVENKTLRCSVAAKQIVNFCFFNQSGD